MDSFNSISSSYKLISRVLQVQRKEREIFFLYFGVLSVQKDLLSIHFEKLTIIFGVIWLAEIYTSLFIRSVIPNSSLHAEY